MTEKQILSIMEEVQKCILDLEDIYGKDSGTYYACLEILVECNQNLMKFLNNNNILNAHIKKIKKKIETFKKREVKNNNDQNLEINVNFNDTENPDKF